MAGAEVDHRAAEPLHRAGGHGAEDRLRLRGAAGGRIDQEVVQLAVDQERRGVSAAGQGLDEDLPAFHGRAAGRMPAAASRPTVSASGRPTTLE